MTLLPKIARRIKRALPYLEDPRLWDLNQQGGLVETFLKLNQPWFHQYQFATVLDIGANVGQFALTISKVLPEAQIFAFEPIPACFAKLQQNLQGHKDFTALNMGLWTETWELEFECNAYTPSSSFLTMTQVHTEAFPFTKETEKIQVKIEPLDRVSAELNLRDPMLIKIDVQGYEDRVMQGGEQTIKRAKMIILETSFRRLYEQQPLFNDIYQILNSWGFSYVGALDQLVNPKTGDILQADSIFIQRSL